MVSMTLNSFYTIHFFWAKDLL